MEIQYFVDHYFIPSVYCFFVIVFLVLLYSFPSIIKDIRKDNRHRKLLNAVMVTCVVGDSKSSSMEIRTFSEALDLIAQNFIAAAEKTNGAVEATINLQMDLKKDIANIV